MDMSQYLEIFIVETGEHLQSLNQSLLSLEKNPGERSMLDEIFRVAHTLKGMSGTMGFNRMSRLTHNMENVLQALRNDEIKINTELVDLLFKCLDALETYLTLVSETGNEGIDDNLSLINSLSALLKNIVSENTPPSSTFMSNVLKTNAGSKSELTGKYPLLELNQYDLNVINNASNLGFNTYQINIKLDNGCLLKSARAFVIFKTLEKCSEIIKSEPKVQDIEDEKFDFEFAVIVVSKDDESVFQKALNSIVEVEEVDIKLIKEKNHDAKGDASGAALQESSGKDYQAGEHVLENGQTNNEASSRKAKTGKTVRVDIERLDLLLNLVSELIIQKTRLEGLEGITKTKEWTETLEYLEKITTSLHDAVMKVRMVPVETVFNRFPRMIRDISKDVGKNVILSMSGEETELDRTVIDEIGDPLIHLLRNSVDHGIEPAEKRKGLGKPENGNIALRAYQDGNNVVIEVEDDGGGIDIERVRKMAIDKGIVNIDSAANLSDKEVIDFLFQPSFSTADKVTNLSGRGVGLDVVKTKIESLGGVVEVETVLGNGTRFFIRLPLTLAIIQALLVMVGSEKYAIQLSSIHKIMNIAPEEIKMVQKQEVVLYRNTVVPVVRLDEALEVPQKAVKQKVMKLVIVKRGERLTGLVVDKILGQQEIVQKSLGKFLSGIKVVTSATILGDGNVALILDVNSFAR